MHPTGAIPPANSPAGEASSWTSRLLYQPVAMAFAVLATPEQNSPTYSAAIVRSPRP